MIVFLGSSRGGVSRIGLLCKSVSEQSGGRRHPSLLLGQIDFFDDYSCLCGAFIFFHGSLAVFYAYRLDTGVMSLLKDDLSGSPR